MIRTVDSTGLRLLEPAVSITTLRKDAGRVYLEALKDNARFEARGRCLYVDDDQAVWSFGTAVRQKEGSSEYEVVDSQGRKLAETGTTVRWGGGQVSANEAAANEFNEKLVMDPECESGQHSYWLVGEIERPLFDSKN